MDSPNQVTIRISDLGISDYALGLFESGYPRDAIRHEAQDLLNELQQRIGRDDIDGQTLIEIALRDNKPILEFNQRSTPKERDEHASLRLFLLGVNRAVRNVYSHDVRTDVSALEATIWLGLLGRLRDQLERTYLVSIGPESQKAD